MIARMSEGSAVERAREFVVATYRAAGAPPEAAQHALAVGDLLVELGVEDHVVVAGILHDVIEDTGAAPTTLSDAFGPRVTELVAALTEDASIADYRDRKRALRDAIARAGYSALAISAADKVARLRDAERRRLPLEPARLEHARRTYELLLAAGIRTAHVEELGQRLARLRRASLPE